MEDSGGLNERKNNIDEKNKSLYINQKGISEKNNTNNNINSSLLLFFNQQLEKWDEVLNRYKELNKMETRELTEDSFTIKLQWNPARMVSTGAKLDAKTLAKRPCFLCAQNRPLQQIKKNFGNYEILVNPFPIMPNHFTIPSLEHRSQSILNSYGMINELLQEYQDLMVFYNGPQCGASAPDHSHFQAVTNGLLPLQKYWDQLSKDLIEVVKINNVEGIFIINKYPCPALVIKSVTKENDEKLFKKLYDSLVILTEDNQEPPMNIVAWRKDIQYLAVVFPRSKRRPSCFNAKGDEQYMITPGALEMSGLMVTPRQEDFKRLKSEKAFDILREVSIDKISLLKVVENLKKSKI